MMVRKLFACETKTEKAAPTMAILRQYREGGFYIIRGYPIRLQGNLRGTQFTTLQVLPRAQAFFEEVGFNNGTRIEPYIFYAILVDGDLSSPSIARRKPTVTDIPSDVMDKVVALAKVEDFASFFGAPEILKCRCLLDYYRHFKARVTDPGQSLTLARQAAVVCLVNHFRSAQFRGEII